MKNFGEYIKTKRKSLNMTLRELANKSKIDFSLLSKFENNNRKPSPLYLARLTEALKLNDEEFLELQKLGKYIQNNHPKGGETAQMKNEEIKPSSMQVNMPTNLLVIYSDAAMFAINQYGVVLDFAQTFGATGQRNIVSRIGMSKEHAMVFAEKLLGLLKKDKENQKALIRSEKVSN